MVGLLLETDLGNPTYKKPREYGQTKKRELDECCAKEEGGGIISPPLATMRNVACFADRKYIANCDVTCFKRKEQAVPECRESARRGWGVLCRRVATKAESIRKTSEQK